MFDFKRASKTELTAQYKRIAAISGDDMFFTKKELRHLPEVLMDMEQVLAFSSGLMDGNTWLIVLTDRRVLFLDKGILYGLKQAAIPINKINAVSGKTGLLLGTIEISDGSATRRIKNVPKQTVIPFTNKVQEVIEQHSGN